MRIISQQTPALSGVCYIWPVYILYISYMINMLCVHCFASIYSTCSHVLYGIKYR
nr:MAG TPA: hypothetical protein [Caudoviricetes sp.]